MPVLRIALLTDSTGPRGSAVHTLALAEALARAGQQVTVWALARGGATGFFRPVDPAVQVRIVPVPDPEDEDAEAEVRRSITLLSAAFAAAQGGSAADRYDVVQAQDATTANAVPGRIRTVRHLDHVTTPELVTADRRALLQSRVRICVSAPVAAELLATESETGELTEDEADAGQETVVIPGGVEAARFAAAAGDQPEAVAQRQYWTDRFGDFVLAVGGIEPRKGTLELVRAMARVRRRRPGTRLVIAGPDTADHRDYRREVEALALRLRIDPELLGPVEHAVLPSLVAAAGAFAFPSVQAGSGLAAMEALAVGIPVVTRELPALRETFGDAVRYAAPGDGSSGDIAAGLAAELVAALEARPDPNRAGPALAAGHSWDDAATAHLQLYGRLISAGKPVGSLD